MAQQQRKALRREELRRFLKAARMRISPTDFSLPSYGRRRSPGLRREEVASLAGMSVTWYTWFEQGREVQLSVDMLERLAFTLRLTEQERSFLYALAQHRPPPLTEVPTSAVAATENKVPPGVQHLLDNLSLPAQVLTEDWTVIGWNQLVARAFRDYAKLPPEARNLFRILLFDERYQRDLEKYRIMVKRLTARFKWDYSQAHHPEAFEALITEAMQRSRLFCEFWHDTNIIHYFEDVHSVEVPEIGQITLRHTSYIIEQSPGQRLMLFVPTDKKSTENLHRLSCSVVPGHLPCEEPAHVESLPR